MSAVEQGRRGGATRRAVVRAGAWSVPAVTLVAAAPSSAASGSTRATTPVVTRYAVLGDPASADYRVDVSLTGASPTAPRVVWTPGATGVHSVFENSSNLVHVAGDFADQATTWLLSGTSFWLRDTLAGTAVGSMTLQLLDGPRCSTTSWSRSTARCPRCRLRAPSARPRAPGARRRRTVAGSPR